MEVQLTGNPFVDTGLGVIAYLAGCRDIHSLRLQDLHKVHRDGKTLTQRNLELKSMTMIFSNNSLATNPAIKDPKKRIEYYSALTTAIMNNIGKEDLAERCESCGNDRSLDIDTLVRKTLVPLGFNDSTKYVGRDWFPLAGSMGSDAQALPSASRAPNICAKCLFSVHYLPLGVLLVNGRLALFQSTSLSFWFEMVREIAGEIDDRVRANIFDTLGAKEGSTSAVSRLFKIMRDAELDDLEPESTLFLWLFSNSGTAPDCSLEEIPNSALKFIQSATRTVVDFKEISKLLNADKGRSADFSLLGCISRGVDYDLLYPKRGYSGVSNELFSTYQVTIRNVPLSRLRTAHKVAAYLRKVISDSKQLQRITKDISQELSIQNEVRKAVANMIQQGLLTYEEYSSLFLDLTSVHLKINHDAWKFIKFYLPKDLVKFPATLASNENKKEAANFNLNTPEGQKPEYYKRLQYVAARIYEIFLEERGKEKLPVLLSSIARRETKPSWLQMQFIKLADKHDGFTYSDWAALCVGENGKDLSWEVLTQLRLIWTERLQNRTIASEAVKDRDGISQEFPALKKTAQRDQYEELASKIVSRYLEKNGEGKLRKYVLEGLRKRELGLYWFREQLSSIDSRFKDDDYWAEFLEDGDGKSIPLTRLFQLHLSMRNVLRQHTFKHVPLLR